MGLLPDPGGLTLEQMIDADLDALWVVGANPFEGTNKLKHIPHRLLVVQEMFLTETAQAADIVFPASSAYEKSGTVTNVCGEVQRLKKGLQAMGTKPDLEIIGLIAKEMGLASLVGPWSPEAVAGEIRRNGTQNGDHRGRRDPVRSSHDTL